MEETVIQTLQPLGIMGQRLDVNSGVWVGRNKIAAIGIRVRKWITLHGIAINIEPDLSHFAGIVPCGVMEPRFGVTSLADLGLQLSMVEVDMVLRREFETLFGATARSGH